MQSARMVIRGYLQTGVPFTPPSPFNYHRQINPFTVCIASMLHCYLKDNILIVQQEIYMLYHFISYFILTIDRLKTAPAKVHI